MLEQASILERPLDSNKPLPNEYWFKGYKIDLIRTFENTSSEAKWQAFIYPLFKNTYISVISVGKYSTRLKAALEAEKNVLTLWESNFEV